MLEFFLLMRKNIVKLMHFYVRYVALNVSHKFLLNHQLKLSLAKKSKIKINYKFNAIKGKMLES